MSDAVTVNPVPAEHLPDRWELAIAPQSRGGGTYRMTLLPEEANELLGDLAKAVFPKYRILAVPEEMYEEAERLLDDKGIPRLDIQQDLST